jgi:hypothetical protein
VLSENFDLSSLKKTQKIKVVCDRCGAISEKLVYNLLKQREKRNGEDVCKSCATTEYNKSRPIEVRLKAGEGCRIKHKGKKLEEIVGLNKANEMKQKFSISKSGKNNVNFGAKFSRGFADRPLSGSWEERYGKDKSEKMKKRMSEANSGANNPMYGKPAPIKSGNGISGWYKEFYFRSLLELSYILHLESQSINFVSCESCQKKFKYTIDNRHFSYFPDFYLLESNEYVEIKPSSMIKNRIVLAKAQSVIDAGEKFTFVTQKDIIKIKKEELLKLMNDGSVTIDEGKKEWVLNQ